MPAASSPRSQTKTRCGARSIAGRVTLYQGFDPTATSLHTGNLVGIMALAHLQRAGHRPIAVVGGGTGMIGDPSERASERPMLSVDEIHRNLAGHPRASSSRTWIFPTIAR